MKKTKERRLNLDVSADNFQNTGTYFQPEVLYDEEYGTYLDDPSRYKDDKEHRCPSCHECENKNHTSDNSNKKDS